MGIHEKIKAAQVRKTEKVAIDSLDDSVWIQKIRMGELEQIQKTEGNITRSAEFIAYCVMDEEGKALFNNAAEVKKLDKDLFDELSIKVAEVNGLIAEDAEDDDEKN